MTTQKPSETGVKTLMAALGIANLMAAPRIEKVVINIGIGKTRQTQPALIETLKQDIAAITGQKPVVTTSKKAISGFKLQKGQPAGLKVTLRGSRMYEFLTKLSNVVLPEIRDFKGVPMQNIDSNGNLHIGLHEHTLFPEIGFEDRTVPHGLQITIAARLPQKSQLSSRDTAAQLYRSLGIPLQEA